MDLTSEVGLRLLLSPMGSSVVLKTACCTVGTVLPIYSTFKAIEKKDQSEQQKWLIYWAGSLDTAAAFHWGTICSFTEFLQHEDTDLHSLYRMPLYYHVKFAFLVWLQLPPGFGAKGLYDSHLRPFLLRRQARLDKIVDHIYTGMNNFVSAHEGEIKIARLLSLRLVTSVRDCIHPVQREPTVPTIEAPRRSLSLSDSQSEDEEDEDEEEGDD